MPSLNLSDAQQLAAAIFEPDDIIELRAIDHTNGYTVGELCRARDLASDGMVAWIEQQNTKRSVYYGVNPRTLGMQSGKNGTCTDADVSIARCLFVDIDDIDPALAARVCNEASIASPTAIVSSGRGMGVHIYWRLEEPCEDIDLWRAYMRGAIRALSADIKCHNPSRVLKLPGSIATKYQTRCVLIACDPGRVYAIDDLGIEPLKSTDPTALRLRAAFGNPDPAGLHQKTKDILGGFWTPPDGTRNNAFFAAACNLESCCYPVGYAYENLGRRAAEAGLDDSEIENIIRSAYSKQRTNQKTPKVLGADPVSVPDYIRELSNQPHPPTGVTPGEEAEPPVVAGFRGRIANRTMHLGPPDDDGKRKAFWVVTPPNMIEQQIDEATNKRIHFARSVGLFMTMPPKTSQHSEQVWMLAKPEQLFAAMHANTPPDWKTTNSYIIDHEGGFAPANAMTKTEFFEWYVAHCKRRYEMVSRMPHHKPIDGYFYLKYPEPKRDGSALRELLAALNPATELDRALLLACILTPGWAGPVGRRPLFVFEVADGGGMGSGKTSTAVAISRLWGSVALFSNPNDWETLMKAIMSSDEFWDSRVFIIDNMKDKLGGQALEAAITAPHLQGHRMYVGPIIRPNDASWIVTANNPVLTPDAAARAVTIRFGKPIHGGHDFDRFIDDFMHTRGCEAVWDAIDLIRTGGSIADGTSFRFLEWAREVVGVVHTGIAGVGHHKGETITPETIIDECRRRMLQLDDTVETASNIIEVLAERVEVDYDGTMSISARAVFRALVSKNMWDHDPRHTAEHIAIRNAANHAINLLGPKGVLCRDENTDSDGKPKRYRCDEDGKYWPSGQYRSTRLRWNNARATEALGYSPIAEPDDEIPI